MKQRKINLIFLITILIFSCTYNYAQTKSTQVISENLTKSKKTNSEMSSEEKLIWLTYRKLELYNMVRQYSEGKKIKEITKKDSALTFTLSNFKSGDINEIRNVPYNELVSPPEGEIIELIQSVSQNTVGDVKEAEKTTYGAKWVKGKYVRGGDRNWTIGDILKLETARFYDVKRYISFEAKVSFQGKSRIYKALVFNQGSLENPVLDFLDVVVGMGGHMTRIWKEQRLPFGLVDNSNWGANQIYDTTSFIAKVHRFLNLNNNSSRSNIKGISCPGDSQEIKQCCISQELAAFWGISSCNVWEPEIDNLISQLRSGNDNELASSFISFYSSDNKYHIGGGVHYGRARFYPSCRSTSSSQQRCEIQIRDQGYADIQTDHEDYYYHVGATKEIKNGKTGPRGQNIECDSSLGFGFNRCLFSGCNVELTLSVSGRGLGATATISGAGLWDTAKSEGLICNLAGPVGNVEHECVQDCINTALTSDSKVNGSDRYYSGPCCEVTPIVVDIEGDGFSLTSASNGVMFDFNGDGVPHRVSWTKADSDEAWLVLDRNANGTIDDGSELFGNMTPQPQVDQKHGFLALAEYDKVENGGNEDGKINKLDAIFSELRLWQDKNHNGISERSELKKLRKLDVKAFKLDFRTSNRTDRHGNAFRYKAKVKDTRDGNVGKWAWDVFLVLDRAESDLTNVQVHK